MMQIPIFEVYSLVNKLNQSINTMKKDKKAQRTHFRYTRIELKIKQFNVK